MRRLRAPIAFALLAACLPVVAWSADVTVALALLPALLLAAPLLAGRYLGEHAIGGLRRSRHRERRRRAQPPVLVRRNRPTARRSGGRLLADRLAGRAPPVAALPAPVC